ncbi:MAG: hypothetical protein AVW05_02075, partial [Hadesarchaea archaeon DG-33]
MIGMGMRNEIKLLALLVGIAVVAASVVWMLPVQEQPTPLENIFAEQGPKAALASFYEPENVFIEPSVPPYTLPLKSWSVVNFDKVTSKFGLTEQQIEMMKKNGFVVAPQGPYGSWMLMHYNDVVEAYKDLKEEDIPIFVTSDTLLHLYHIQFNEILTDIENEEFFDKVKKMSEAMLNESLNQYDSLTGDLKEAVRRNVAYFAVGLKLLAPDTIVPEFVEDEVTTELQLIEQHSGFVPSPIFGYKEDYSQYVPRGHYTRSERLEKYFKAMMWYGRMAFLLRGDPYTISEETARIQTLGASLISNSMDKVKTDNASVGDFWNRVYAVTSFFVGLADDLTPYEYKEAILEVFGENFDVTELEKDNQLLNLKVALAKMPSPRIYGGTGNIPVEPTLEWGSEALENLLEKTKGMRFMGQRYVPDSYIFQNLVYPAVGRFTGSGEPFTMGMIIGFGPGRAFPRGLDVMAVLGSDRAWEILQAEGDTAFENYSEQLGKLRGEFAAFDENNWNRNMYWSWLYALKALLIEPGEGYPTFMQTHAWQDKELNTALASWAELRHDTILYAKQSYTPWMGIPEPKPVVGYVEPVPEFYARILALTKMTSRGLTEMNVLDQGSKDRLQHLENLLDRLLTISKKELKNEELTEEDYKFIREFGEKLEPVVAGMEDLAKETRMIADVHTDTNSRRVLEEGTGYLDWILVAYKVPDGRIIMGAGPVLSHYEFKQPMSDRLTDEGWMELLESNPPT